MQGGKSQKAQPFSEHVRELRRRLIYSIAALFLGSIIGYFIHEQLFSIITRPLHAQLYYTTPTGGFNAIIKISILFGVVVAVPVFVYQLGKFLSPSFIRYQNNALRMMLFSVALALLGASFAYYVSLPAALHFLANVDSKDLHSIITVNEYLNFVIGYVAGFALLFQLPLVMLFINRIKPQKPWRLMRIQRWVILISFIVAAFLTPTPDPVNQAIMAFPIILLYQFSVILIWLVNRRRKITVAEPLPISVMPRETSAPTPAPAPAPATLPQPRTKIPAQQKPLIMDVFWVPQNPMS